jgi:hypothetical protein
MAKSWFEDGTRPQGPNAGETATGTMGGSRPVPDMLETRSGGRMTHPAPTAKARLQVRSETP